MGEGGGVPDFGNNWIGMFQVNILVLGWKFRYFLPKKLPLSIPSLTYFVVTKTFKGVTPLFIKVSLTTILENRQTWLDGYTKYYYSLQDMKTLQSISFQ